MKKVNPYTLYLSGVLSENQYLSEVEAPAAPAPDNKTLLDSFSSKKPKMGDRAYSMYHGKEGVGILWSRDPGHDSFSGARPVGYLIVTNQHGLPVENPWFSDKNQQLSVGYDDPIVWDSKRNMWYAPADRD
jgi:hypothetical protein